MTEANGMGSEHWYDAETGAVVINETTVPSEEVFSALRNHNPEVAALVRWGSSIQRPSRNVGIFDRDRFVTPQNIFQQFRVAMDAAENDDVVSGVVESTEALAFNSITMTVEDEDQEDIWNQIMEDVDIESRIREMWSETFKLSQFYCGVVWGTKDYKVKKKTQKGNKPRKEFKGLRVPIGITVLDPMKVVPIGNTLFGSSKLVYLAQEDEAPHFDAVLAEFNSSDQVVSQLIKSKYVADRTELQWLREVTGSQMIQEENLYLLNPDNVFRHTATKPGYMRFATVRMKSVFELLDLKHQLRQMDRAYLIGGTNFIILVKKGSDEYPAHQDEVNAMATQVQGSARVPVIVSDHRLDIEIITPDIDMTLKPERYNTLDARITARLYQMFMTGNYAAGASGDDSIKLARVVTKGMESRRDMIYNSIAKNILKPIYEQNDELTDEVVMDFHPQRIALDFDNNIAVFLQDLRDRGDLSRDTMLSEVGLSQKAEALKREREKTNFDKIFKPVNVPIPGVIPGGPGAAQPGGMNPADQKGAGRRGGGNTNGGGANRQATVSQPGKGTVPDKKVKNPGKAKAELDDDESQ